MPVIPDKGVNVLTSQPSFHLAPQVCGDTLLVRKFGETVVAKTLHSFVNYAIIVADGAI